MNTISIKSDGNGGFNIQKGTFALILCLIALFSTVATVVAYGVTIKADVNYLKGEVEKVAINNPVAQKEIDSRLLGHDIAIIKNQEQIKSIVDDVGDIKEDVDKITDGIEEIKELLK